jgi:hypothetical protein
MARIRTVKPEFWTDERVGECSVSARLLLIASLNFADDHGGLERSSKQLKAQAFPYDAIDCEPLVLELIRQGLFIEYEVANRIYLHIKGFSKHQRVEKPAKPRIPLYEESLQVHRPLPESSPTPHLGVTVSSLEGIKDQGSRKGSIPLTPFDASSVADLDPKAWGDWVEYRKRRKPAIKSESMQAAAEEMARLGASQQDAVKHSIANGYQGLVERKEAGGGWREKAYRSPRSADELEAEERARAS